MRYRHNKLTSLIPILVILTGASAGVYLTHRHRAHPPSGTSQKAAGQAGSETATTKTATTAQPPVKPSLDDLANNRSDANITSGTVGSKSTPAGATCSPTQKTVSGPGTVQLTLTIHACFKDGGYVSSYGSYNYTKASNVALDRPYAQINKVRDGTNTYDLYNSTVSYSYTALPATQTRLAAKY